ncbi:thermonuclease family protein [Mesorhizobium sp. ArgA1]
MADVAGEMLKAGIAITLPDDADRRIPTYAQLEREARKSYRGIWQEPLPWLYRKSSPPRP